MFVDENSSLHPWIKTIMLSLSANIGCYLIVMVFRYMATEQILTLCSNNNLLFVERS